jgi:hypothetical protein
MEKQIISRTDLINFLIQKNNLKSYLEIGIECGINFKNIICDNKIGVDPDTNSQANIFKTSDDFFSENNKKFDIIFIDGLHYAEQVYKDIINSLKFLEPNGFIICHDINPLEEYLQIIPRLQSAWTGDCWKAWVKLRNQLINYNMTVVNICTGCGIIKKGKYVPLNLSISDLNYKFLEQNRVELLNYKTIDEYIKNFHTYYD